LNTDYLRIELCKALHGDCVYVEWGGATGKHRMLIDGGPIGAYQALSARITRLPTDERCFELMVLSHVDTDHIEGMVRLLAEPVTQWPFQVKDVWFNGWRHMQDEDTLGGRQGEFFSALLQHRLKPGAWNGAFRGGAVVVPPEGPLPIVSLAR
jgi:metal-dependent hydrolase (beta-lactamase superfamily II)